MQPYQKANEEIKRHQQIPTKVLGSAISAATAISGGGALAKRALPFLSKYIPADLMRKGLSKLDPRFGKFIEGSLDHGYNIDEVRNFMSGKLEEPQNNQSEKPKSEDPLQDFETNHNDIAQALARIMQNGQSPDAAAAILKSSSAFSKKIKDLEKQKGKNFIDYILEIFGNRGQGTQQQPMQPEMQQTQQQALQQVSNVDSQLMAALDKILKM